jgi:copper chaperone
MEKEMASAAFDVPAMYADHHVTEVRRILLAIPGVEEVNASSAFQVVQIDYDPEKTSEDILRQALDDNGYLGDLQIPIESGKPAIGSDGKTYFRHTAAHKATGTDISFEQVLASSGRPLWPCPGMGARTKLDDEGEPKHG